MNTTNTLDLESKTLGTQKNVLHLRPKSFPKKMDSEKLDIFLKSISTKIIVSDIDRVCIDYFHIHAVVYHFIHYCITNEENPEMLNMEAFLKNKSQKISSSYHHSNEISDNRGEIDIKEDVIIESVLRIFAVHLKQSGKMTLFEVSKAILVDDENSPILYPTKDYRNLFDFSKSFGKNMSAKPNLKKGSNFANILKPLSLMMKNANSTNEVKIVNTKYIRNGINRIRQAIEIPVSVPLSYISRIEHEECFYKCTKLIPFDFVNMLSMPKRTYYASSLCVFGHDVSNIIIEARKEFVKLSSSKVYVNIFRRENRDIHIFYDEVFGNIVDDMDYFHVLVGNVSTQLTANTKTANIVIKSFDAFHSKQQVCISGLLTSDTSLHNYDLKEKSNYYSMTSSITYKSVISTLRILLINMVGTNQNPRDVETFVNRRKKSLEQYVSSLEKPLAKSRTIVADPPQKLLVDQIMRLLKDSKLVEEYNKYTSQSEAVEFMFEIYRILNHIQIASIFFSDKMFKNYCYFAKAAILTLMYTERSHKEVRITVGLNRVPPLRNAFMAFLKSGIVVYGDNDIYKTMKSFIDKGADKLPSKYGGYKTLMDDFESGKSAGISLIDVEGDFKAPDLNELLGKTFPANVKDFSDKDAFKRLHIGIFVFNLTMKFFRESSFKYIQEIPRMVANIQRNSLNNLLKFYRVNNFVANTQSDGYVALIYTAAKFSLWSSILNKDKSADVTRHPNIVTPVRLLELAWNVLSKDPKKYSTIRLSRGYANIVNRFVKQTRKSYTKDLFKCIYSILNNHKVDTKEFEKIHKVKFVKIFRFTIEQIARFYRDISIEVFSTINIHAAQVELSTKVFKKQLPSKMAILVKYLNISTNFLMIRNKKNKFVLKNKFTPIRHVFSEPVYPVFEKDEEKVFSTGYMDSLSTTSPTTLQIFSEESPASSNSLYAQPDEFSLGLDDEEEEFEISDEDNGWDGVFDDPTEEWGLEPVSL